MKAKFDKMMEGKSPQEQIQTLLNIAKEKGYDVNKKMFTEQQLREAGLIK